MYLEKCKKKHRKKLGSTASAAPFITKRQSEDKNAAGINPASKKKKYANGENLILTDSRKNLNKNTQSQAPHHIPCSHQI